MTTGARREARPVARRRHAAGGAPRVSVVTATFNARSLLPATLASVQSQTLAPVEHVVVDGGSTDGTLELLAGLDSSRVTWTSGPDRGIYDALNKGIGQARGEWLYFLGAGDVLAGPEVLTRALAAPAGSSLIYGDVLIGQRARRYGGRFSRLRICRQNICHQAILYHRSLFERHGVYDLRYPVWADWAFNIRCFADRGVRPRYVPLVFARYDDTGFSSRRQDRAFMDDAARLIRPLGLASLAVYYAKQVARRVLGRER